jgi:hypothetical protein
LQKALSIYPDKNQANQTNPYLVPDKNLPKVGIDFFSYYFFRGQGQGVI